MSATAVEVVQRVEIQPLGKRHTFERREWSCAACGESYTDNEQGRANAKAERAAKAEALRSITGDDVRAFREHLGARQGKLEQLLGLSPGALSRWESGGARGARVRRRDVPADRPAPEPAARTCRRDGGRVHRERAIEGRPAACGNPGARHPQVAGRAKKGETSRGRGAACHEERDAETGDEVARARPVGRWR
jgi:DNA-binding transcriptional regulator YiaG